jgi:hypothetical protein
MSMEDRHAETRNEDHNLARLLRNTQREAEICAGYALEAEAAGDKRLAGFFQEVQTMHESVVEKAEAILAKEARANLKVVPVRVDPAPGTSRRGGIYLDWQEDWARTAARPAALVAERSASLAFGTNYFSRHPRVVVARRIY